MDKKKKRIILKTVKELKYGETVVMDHDQLGDNLSGRMDLVKRMLSEINTTKAVVKNEYNKIVKIIF